MTITITITITVTVILLINITYLTKRFFWYYTYDLCGTYCVIPFLNKRCRKVQSLLGLCIVLMLNVYFIK